MRLCQQLLSLLLIYSNIGCVIILCVVLCYACAPLVHTPHLRLFSLRRNGCRTYDAYLLFCILHELSLILYVYSMCCCCWCYVANRVPRTINLPQTVDVSIGLTKTASGRNKSSARWANACVGWISGSRAHVIDISVAGWAMRWWWCIQTAIAARYIDISEYCVLCVFVWRQ